MAELIILIEAYQTWIYIGLGLIGLVYLRLTLKWWAERRDALFGLERERALSGLRRSAAMLTLVLAAAVGTFLAVTFVGPSLPLSTRPTPLPTVSLLATVQPEETLGADGPSATALPVGTADAAGCANPEATLTSPTPGETISGVIEVQGTASIGNFAFYKFEFRLANSNDVWQAIAAGTTPVNDNLLGTWDTTLVPSGEYAFRLVVTDTAGNAPLPCVIQIRVAPAPDGG
ncbi:MAG: hypothetical protein WBR18_00350 [Anaerolineales bacterium]